MLDYNSTRLVTLRLDTTRHVRCVEPMHFGCVELVEQGSIRSSRRARHIERVVSRPGEPCGIWAYNCVKWRLALFSRPCCKYIITTSQKSVVFVLQREEATGSGNMTSSTKTASRLMSRLRCGLPTRLLCTGGLSCKPSSSSESTSNLSAARRQTESACDIISGSDRKRLRSSRDRKCSSLDAVASTDSGVGRSLETLDTGSEAASSHVTFSGSPAYDVIARRRSKRRCARLATVDELDTPEAEVVNRSGCHVTENDVIESPMTTRHRCRKVPRMQRQIYSCRKHFYGEIFVLKLWLINWN